MAAIRMGPFQQMRSVLVRATVPAIALLILGGCAREERPLPSPPAQMIRRAPLPSSQPVSAARYVAESGSIDLFVIRSSQLALHRSSSLRVRRLASILIDAHKGTSAQLSFAGRRLNQLPSATLQPQHQAMLNRLLSARNFDATYLTLERNVVREALTLDGTYAARGQSPTLRPVAAERASVMRRDLTLLS